MVFYFDYFELANTIKTEIGHESSTFNTPKKNHDVNP